MTALLRLAYRWLSLPWLRRRAVAQALRLERAGELDEMPDSARERLVVQRAQERGQLAALWDAAEAAHGEREPLGNPFRGPVRVPPPLADLPPVARACWLPLPGEASDPAILAVLDVVSRQPLAAGVLLGRTSPCAEA